MHADIPDGDLPDCDIPNGDIPEHSTRSIAQDIKAYIRRFCRDLGENEASSTVARSMATSIARSWATMRELRRPYNQRCVGAASLYMAWHVTRRPITLQVLSAAFGVGEEDILAICSHIYPIRTQLIKVPALEPLNGGHIEGMLAFLPSPDHGNGSINDEEWRHLQRNDRAWHEALDICVHHTIELGGPRVERISESIAVKIFHQRHLGLRAQSIVVAIAFFMASHLLGSGASLRRIGELVNIDERILAMAYARVYPLRNQLVKPRIITQIGMENLPRAIEALPALNWPPLEA